MPGASRLHYSQAIQNAGQLLTGIFCSYLFNTLDSLSGSDSPLFHRTKSEKFQNRVCYTVL